LDACRRATSAIAPSKAPPSAVATAYFPAFKDDRAGADIRPSFIFKSLYEGARFRAHSMIAAQQTGARP
jgi:hypothetical protein